LDLPRRFYGFVERILELAEKISGFAEKTLPLRAKILLKWNIRGDSTKRNGGIS
jgi:hypothetical protein